MHRTTKFLLSICMLALLFWIGILLADKQSLRTQIVRLHVVANSNSLEDQMEKLAVKDAIVCYLDACINSVNDVATAKELIVRKLSNLNEIANDTLSNFGSEHLASVILSLEEFEKRKYKTISLPSGIYESLRIQIGAGQGRNWWCVVFPALCTPTTTEDFQSAAVSGGFSKNLSKTLSNGEEYEFHFFLLDCIGKIENFLNFS